MMTNQRFKFLRLSLVGVILLLEHSAHAKDHDLSMRCDVRYNECLLLQDTSERYAAAAQQIRAALEAHELEMDQRVPTRDDEIYWIFDDDDGGAAFRLATADEARNQRSASFQAYNKAKLDMREETKQITMNGDTVTLEPEFRMFETPPSGQKLSKRDFCTSFTNLQAIMQRFPVENGKEDKNIKECISETTLCALSHPCKKM